MSNVCKLLCLLPTVISKDNLSKSHFKLMKKDNYLESVLFSADFSSPGKHEGMKFSLFPRPNPFFQKAKNISKFSHYRKHMFQL